ncbi:DUF3891 family protein [Salinisphaera sp. SPP-AMP-43]|uniref:DUF3891 family protein n=1 Tax=Salinisphaera sp. SPP-AMP-43 TaxID=3121288 RepID=UPI003C6E40AC
MFKSCCRERILPQFEHSRLAGMLAWHWGNDRFDRPAIDFADFAEGVTLHDWHYGLLDNHPLGATDHAEWLAIAQHGVAIDYSRDAVDIVAKRHLRRLIGSPADHATQALLDRLTAKIEQRTQRCPYPAAAFAWADCLTRFCDTVAFHFGFEHLGWHRASVCAIRGDDTEVEIAYEITAKAGIHFEPWPFSPPEFGMPLTAFASAGYPDRLEPIVVYAHCRPA